MHYVTILTHDLLSPYCACMLNLASAALFQLWCGYALLHSPALRIVAKPLVPAS